MSSGLMSCVRENSPPLEFDMSASGPLSLPEAGNTSAGICMSGMATSTPVSAASSKEGSSASANANVSTPNTEQQKRRRFHPLRNLRRIFRRRTITSAADTNAAAAAASSGSSNTLPPTASCSSEKNLRSATLHNVISPSTVAASASSPSSPLTHQQLQDAYHTQSLPKPKSYGAHRDELLSVILGKKKSKHSKSPLALATPTHGENSPAHQSAHGRQHGDMYSATTSSTSSTTYHQHFHQQMHTQSRQSLGIAVFPSAMNRSFYTESQKLGSVGDSSQELDSSGNESGLHTNTNSGIGGGGHLNFSTSNGGEMSDSQRSLSEGRLVDSDYTRDVLSQSHDSVFSESATASSLSIVLKAELADVLRKRRNQPDASDEDLGLPRSPASPQRRMGGMASRNGGGGMTSSTHKNASGTTASMNVTSEVSSLSLLSMNSTDGEDVIRGKANGITQDEERMISSSTRYNARMSSMSMCSDILRPQNDEVDRVSTDRQRLSHSAAMHKMAIRPTKKKVPSRQHRRTLESSIPEANEDILKAVGQPILKLTIDADIKTKTRSLPPGINSKLSEKHPPADITTTTTTASSASKRNKTVESSKKEATSNSTSSKITTTSSSVQQTSTTTSSTKSSHTFGLRTLAGALFDNRESSTDDVDTNSVNTVETQESGFLRRLIQRNSKRNIAKATAGEENSETNESEPKKLQISTSCLDATNREPLLLPNISRSATSYEQNIEETRKTIKREINNEGKSGLSAMLNTFGLSTNSTTQLPQPQSQATSSASKPKSGPAARQRYMPKELSSPGSTLEKQSNSNSSLDEEVISVTNLLSKTSRGNDTFQSTTIIREITAAQAITNQKTQQQMQKLSTSPAKLDAPPTYEKKAKIVGLSPFQQKLSRSNDSFGRSSNSSNSLETSTDEPSPLYYDEKQRKTVEKSRSFRNFAQDEREAGIAGGLNSNGVHTNMPSMPDLSLSFCVPTSYYHDSKIPATISPLSPTSPTDNKCVSLGFEINDNKLLKSPTKPSSLRAESADQLPITGKQKTPTKLLTTGAVVPKLSPSGSTNLSEIEQNIDMIVKSPFVSVLRKTVKEEESPERQQKVQHATIVEVKPEAPKTTAHGNKERPNMLDLKQTTKSPVKRTDQQPQLTPPTPNTAAVPLREKSKPVNSTKFVTDAERKSVPVSTAKVHSFKSSRRNSAVVADSSATSGDSDNGSSGVGGVPEFMKIQLNRVDPTRLNKTQNVVLAKNIKEKELPNDRSQSTDDLSSSRRTSSDSIEIVEHPISASPQRLATNLYFDAISKQTRAVSANSIRSSLSSNVGSYEVLTPKSPVKQVSPVTKSPIKTPVISPVIVTPKSPVKITPVSSAAAKPSPTIADDATVGNMRHANVESSSKNNSQISLEERKRLFLQEDKSKADKKIVDLRNERKKSINEELYRKSLKNEDCVGEIIPPVANTAATESCLIDAVPVVLRKKSFGTVQVHNGHSNTSGGTASVPSDATPELMKVFARRSLKVKDEDVPALANSGALKKNNNSHGVSINNSNASSVQQQSTQQQQQSMDSDKENQSASEEKLDKINKYETNMEATSKIVSNNRNSLADFRNGGGGGGGLSFVNNNNNASNNNNNNNNNQGHNIASVHNNNNNNNNKAYLPPIKHTNNNNNSIRPHSTNNNNHNHNNNNNKVINERYSLHYNKKDMQTINHNNTTAAGSAPTTTTTPATTKNTKPNTLSSDEDAMCMQETTTTTATKSTTVGEFKGILQRRAEWEQRAKEALK